MQSFLQAVLVKVTGLRQSRTLCPHSVSTETLVEKDSRVGKPVQNNHNHTEKDPGSWSILQQNGQVCALERMPANVIDSITGLLDPVSLICLELTNSRFRRLLNKRRKKLSQCEEWRLHCLLEVDLIEKGAFLPKRLTCAFCKSSHRHDIFGEGSWFDAGYGFEELDMIKNNAPFSRYCWNQLPKRIDYTPTFRNAQHEQWARSLLEDR